MNDRNLNHTPQLWCVTSADQNEIDGGELDRLLRSVEGSEAQFVLVLRNVPPETTARLSVHANVTRVVNSGKLSLSLARNKGLQALNDLHPDDSDLICFPDDDSHFWPGQVSRIICVARDFGADFIGGSYGEVPPTSEQVRRMTIRDAFEKISSVGIFLTWRTVKAVGLFNEGLGVGSKILPVGEDNDYALRAWRAADNAVVFEGAKVFHLVNRPTEARPPKHHLTIAAMHLWHAFTWFVIIRGLGSALFQDLKRRKILSWQTTRQALHALSPKRIKRLRQMAIAVED